MPTSQVEILASLIGFLGGGTFLLIGLRMFFAYRARRVGGGEGTKELAETVSELRDDMRALREEMLDLHERVDFTERVIAQQRDARAPADKRLPS